MFLSLLQRLLKPTEQPLVSAIISTFASFLLCISPFILIIVGDMVMHLIQYLLSLLPHFECAWLNAFVEWLQRGIKWLIDNVTMLAMPAIIVLLGTMFAISFLCRSYLTTMIAIYVFKRATESILALHFAAWSVKGLLSFEFFSFLEHRLSEQNLQDFGNGLMVVITLIMWFALKYAFNWQLRIIRKENSATGAFAVLEQIRLVLLDWVERSQSKSKQKTQAKEMKA